MLFMMDKILEYTFIDEINSLAWVVPLMQASSSLLMYKKRAPPSVRLQTTLVGSRM